MMSEQENKKKDLWEKTMESEHKKSLWEKIKSFFKGIIDRLEYLTIPKSQRLALEKQMNISIERNEEAKCKEEKLQEKEYPKQLYNRYLAPLCELNREPVQTRINEMAYDVLTNGKNTSVELPDKSTLTITPEQNKMKVHFSLYDKDGQLVYADKVQFMEKKGSIIADKENTSTARLIRTLNSKDVFEPKTNDVQEKNTSELKEEKTELNKESIKEHIQKENLNELSQEEARNLYHEYVQHYQTNEFDLSPFELSAMVKLVVENQLDKDDDKKFSRTVVLKDPVQKANDVKIKASYDKEAKETRVTYLQGDKEITEKEMVEAWKNAKDVKYTIPEWEKEKLEEKEINKYIPEYHLNLNRITKEIAKVYKANELDLQNSIPPLAYPDAMKDVLESALTKQIDMTILTDIYNCITSCPGESTQMISNKQETIMENIDNNMQINQASLGSDAISLLAMSVDYTIKLSQLPIEGPEWEQFVKANIIETIEQTYNVPEDIRVLAGNAIGNIDIEKLEDTWKEQFNISEEEITQHREYVKEQQSQQYDISPVQESIMPINNSQPEPDLQPVQFDDYDNPDYELNDIADRMMENGIQQEPEYVDFETWTQQAIDETNTYNEEQNINEEYDKYEDYDRDNYEDYLL